MPSTNKMFCPKCKRTLKYGGECPYCKSPLINIGKKWRFPKHLASRNKWKKNLQQLFWRIHDDNLRELYFNHNLPYIVTGTVMPTDSSEIVNLNKLKKKYKHSKIIVRYHESYLIIGRNQNDIKKGEALILLKMP